MAKTVQDFVEETLCSAPEPREHFTLLSRYYNIAVGDSTLIPSIGSQVTPRSLSSYTAGESGSGIQLWRIMSVAWEKTPLGKRLHVVFYQVRAGSFTAATNYTEVHGSRQASSNGERRIATRLFATDDGSTGLPAVGDVFPDDTGILARRCESITDDLTSLPGLHFHTIRYMGFVATPYTATTHSAELSTSRTLRYAGEGVAAVRRFVSDGAATDIPIRGDLYPGDSGISGKRCILATDAIVPGLGLHIHECHYVADVAY